MAGRCSPTGAPRCGRPSWRDPGIASATEAGVSAAEALRRRKAGAPARRGRPCAYPRSRMATSAAEDRLKQQRRALPDGPGVYLFKDEQGKALYVGKARSIRKRVASHFSKPATRGVVEMVDQVAEIDFIATETDAEALLAEQEFIKRHRPLFNVRLRDDKSYPYIGISLDEDYPRIYFTRERHRRNRVYFGPFSNAKRVRETLDLLGQVFMPRTCDGPQPGRASGSPCLDYYIKRCQAPCVGYISKEAYRENVETIIDFLSGRYLDALAAALSERRGAPVEVRYAERGDKRRILEMAVRNARLALDQERLRSERRRSQRIEALDGLQRALGMEQIPMRIECFDISNLMHAHTVASMVVFEGGAPKKSDYRRFAIRESVQDDFAAMAEVLSRRMAQYVKQRERSPHDREYDESFASLPALIVIDGGRRQPSAGLGALREFTDLGGEVGSLP